ncbi:hypothetical protein MMC07_004734 [Pseudocyphellaria aurata]|nr:hypothetical protein [Pseudocyphellaria aurata]
MPKRGEASSVFDTGLSTKADVKDSLLLKPHKVSKTATTSSNDIFIAVFRMTGSGKSDFTSQFTNKRDVKRNDDSSTGTSEIGEVQNRLHNVALVDAPRFDDTDKTDTEILILIRSWIKDIYDDKTRLMGVIYLHRISDNGMTGPSYKNLTISDITNFFEDPEQNNGSAEEKIRGDLAGRSIDADLKDLFKMQGEILAEIITDLDQAIKHAKLTIHSTSHLCISIFLRRITADKSCSFLRKWRAAGARNHEEEEACGPNRRDDLK